LLDQLNIQVENPVAVLDQEEAKKFLCGKPEDKYEFFSKATELERLDRQYASIFDKIDEMSESRAKVERSLLPKKEIVEQLKREWEQFEILERMEEKIEIHRVKYAWSLFWEFKEKQDEATKNLELIDEKLEKRREDLTKAESTATTGSDLETELNQKLAEFTTEAEEASKSLSSQEIKLSTAKQPLKQHARTLKSLVKDQNVAKRRHQLAVNELKKIRDEILQRAGSAESEEARRTTRRVKAEERMKEVKAEVERRAIPIREALTKYQEKEGNQESLSESLNSVKRQLSAVKSKVQGLRSSEGNSMALFGNKCVQMYQRVEKAQRDGRFRGPVVGPIGHHLKVVAGKEHLAALATSAMKVGLDRFIVTNDEDRSYFLRLRKEIRCNSRECLIIQTNQSPRYQVRPPPEGTETCATVITVANDLVFNSLVDTGRIDQKALMNSKAESEEALLITENGRSSIKGGNIREVHILPEGDFWQVFNGAVSMSANRKKLRQLIGIDRTAAIRDGENEVEQLTFEVNDLSSKLNNLKNERHQHKVRWNQLKNEDKKAMLEIRDLEETIDRIREETAAAENVTVDTTEYEDEVNEAERAIEEIKGREEETKKSIEELKNPIRELEAKVEETRARSEKVTLDLNEASKKLQEYVRNKHQRERVLEKKRNKLQQFEDVREKQMADVQERTEKANEAMFKARKVTYQIKQTREKKRKKLEKRDDDQSDNEENESSQEDLESIEPIQVNKNSDYWKGKIVRGEKDIEKERERRKISEVDPEVALDKYQRAKADLETKMEQVVSIEENENNLVNDLKDRKTRWKHFRAHISLMANNSFDEILNKKGSSGFIQFDHKERQLNLVVQKDNRDEMTQTNDVKALSGGERSFTTLSLLLALGESLETPFRVMDEFDVFLDPVARKIALETMISLAKEMDHRQFIFITPQDLSNIKTDPNLKLFHMKPPARSNVVGGATQQTLDF